MYVCTCTCMYIYVCMCMYQIYLILTKLQCTHTCTFKFCMYMHVPIGMYIHVCMYVCLFFSCLHTYMYNINYVCMMQREESIRFSLDQDLRSKWKIDKIGMYGYNVMILLAHSRLYPIFSERNGDCDANGPIGSIFSHPNLDIYTLHIRFSFLAQKTERGIYL